MDIDRRCVLDKKKITYLHCMLELACLFDACLFFLVLFCPHCNIDSLVY